ncbi:unnamed protein product [Clonostachys rosea]|uniref:F-box domain-containing protein n=1 Tax=Bionectria ochroleuca TaxID=29856 RepID=A0ABY6UNI8_BIOOC|nr:unnamed protein product [Clonostachys rosea]
MPPRTRSHSRRPRSLLCDTPPEIITEIFSWLGSSDLWSLCLVNKFLHPIAERALYSSITFKWNYNQQPRIIALLNKLFQRPELFDYITSLTLDGSNDDENRHMPPVAATWHPDVSKYIDHVRTLNTDLTERWVDSIKRGQMDAFAGILLARVTKIRCLSVSGSYLRGNGVIRKIVELKIRGQLPRFERLKVLTYSEPSGFHYDDVPYMFTKAMHLFHIPTITHIAAWMGNPAETFQWPLGEPDLRNLTSLDIEGSRTVTLVGILPLAENLKRLAWRWEYIPKHKGPFMTKVLDLDEIIATFSLVKKTLESLQFRITVHKRKGRLSEEKIDVLGSFGGLRDFNQITDLDVPLACLAGFGDKPQPLDTFIPSGIKTLSLSCGMLLNEAVEWIPIHEGPSDSDIVESVRDLSKNSPTSLPQLQRIRIVDEGDKCFSWKQVDKILEDNPLDHEVTVIRPAFPGSVSNPY